MSKRYEFIKAPQRSPEWFALRKDAITATDIAVISGLSPYKTPFRLFAEKSGKVMEQAAGTAADRGRLRCAGGMRGSAGAGNGAAGAGDGKT